MNCARCSFTDEDLTEHAFDSGHRLCVVCQRRSLTEHQRQTCQACIGSTRVDLADIVEAYTLLEPGGITGLTLLGDGTMQRRAHPYELTVSAAHPLAHPDDTSALAPIRDEWPSDPLPVLPALASWEDWLREDYRDPKGAVPANLSATVDYLTSNLDSRHNFAQTFHGFDDLAHEIRRHRSAGHHAAGLADVPLEAEAVCFDCGGPLLRTYAPPVAPIKEPRRGQKGEGLTDDWTCGWCRLVYDQPSYFLALRAKASSWVPIPLAAETTRRSIWTVRSWARRGLVMTACRVLDHAVLVWWPDVSDRAFRHEERETA